MAAIRGGMVLLFAAAVVVAPCRLTMAQQPDSQRAKLGTPTDVPVLLQLQPGTEITLPPPAQLLTLPISLPAALQLANVRPIDIQLAEQRLAVATAQLQCAELLWLPNIYLGFDYFRHDGQLQDVAGGVSGTSKSNMMIGAAPIAVFATTDAIFAPLAARQDARAQDAALQVSRNDALLAVAESYFNVQQARGDLAGAENGARNAEELVRRTEKLAAGLVPPVEEIRARTDYAQAQTDGERGPRALACCRAELCRLLRLESTLPIEPIEPPFLQISLVRLDLPVDDLIPVALTNRPELAQQQAIVQATLQRLRQEKLRPLMPSVLLRGASTNPGGTLAGGYFGGGFNNHVGDFSWRSDFDVQVLWELQNLGLGNQAKMREKSAEHQLATVELFRTQDRIAAEVVKALAQAQEAAGRVKDAETGVKLAADSVQKNFEGLSQTRRLGADAVVLVIRPQEVLAAIQALAQANSDYYSAVSDYDRAQFRLYRALGHPAQLIVDQECAK